MKPGRFDYVCPRTLPEALEFLAISDVSTKVLAGGQSLMPIMNFRLGRYERLVDINALAELDYIHADGGTLRIGALTRQRTIEESSAIRRHAPLLAEATRHIAHLPIRTRGTIGGSVAHADPAAEDPAVMLALDAQMVARSAAGQRIIPAAQFFENVFTTALQPDELLVELRIPCAGPAQGFAFEEYSRRHGDFAVVGVAAALQRAGGRISKARLAFCGVGPYATRAEAAEHALEASASRDEREAACNLAAEELDPPTDLHADAEYRRHLIAVLTRKAVARAMDAADG
jgi:carbon-monoxide dehydrogenase medium subunit